MENSTWWLPLLLGGLFALIFGGVGVFMLVRYVTARRQAEASKNWPSVIGRVVFSTVNASTSTDSDGSTSTTYAPQVMYSYSVLGTPYQGKQIGFGLEISGSYGSAAKTVARFPGGQEVSVYYNPENPGEAVLEQKVQNNGAALFMMIIFLLIGIAACVIGSGAFLSMVISGLH